MVFTREDFQKPIHWEQRLLYKHDWKGRYFFPWPGTRYWIHVKNCSTFHWILQKPGLQQMVPPNNLSALNVPGVLITDVYCCDQRHLACSQLILPISPLPLCSPSLAAVQRGHWWVSGPEHVYLTETNCMPQLTILITLSVEVFT